MASKTVSRSALLSLVFLCQENPRRSGILIFPDCPRFQCWLMKTRNRRYPRSSGMDGDKSGESGAFLFSQRVPDFCDGRRSFPTNENSNLYRQGRRWWKWLYICLHDTTTKCHAGVSSPRLLYQGENLTPVRNLATVSCKRETTTRFGVKSVCP